ncbi:MAG: putative zinc-binding peptidase, partial [Gammaproteobacteria bacterium]|nr:putative zinc-binding peptidase [Gammaproteobacteria bacterium]
MKILHCVCGRAVYFDNHRCGHCGRQLAFDPETLTMIAEAQVGSGLARCRNHSSVIRCNWLAIRGDNTCLSCATSQTIPMLSKPENHERWRKLEQAKRRLIYNLLQLDLPVDPAKLRFAFKEDRRTNPDVHDVHVSIGHANGVITINAAEADEVYREQMRQQMNEPYRTLLGHFR